MNKIIRVALRELHQGLRADVAAISRLRPRDYTIAQNFIEYARKLENGWYLDTNISNGTKVEIVRTITDAAELVYGINVDLSFENRH